MTKRFYMSKSTFSGDYSLDSGAYGSRREVMGKDSDYLINALQDKIDKKRKTELFIVRDNIPEDTIKDIRKFFSDSKVKVSLTSLLALE